MYPLGAVLCLTLAAAPTPAAARDGGATATTIERLARIGRASGATFSPDGRQIALISDLSGVPQIWIVPAVEDLKPSYQQFAYAPSEKRGVLRLIAGPDKSANPPAAFINQDARMYAAVLGADDSIEYAIRPGRHAWVQCATGALDVNGLALKEGDGLAVSEEPTLRLRGSNGSDSEVLLFDLA